MVKKKKLLAREDPEKIKLYQQRYYQKNKEKHNQYYRERNRERYNTDPEFRKKVIESSKRWNRENRDRKPEDKKLGEIIGKLKKKHGNNK